MISEPLALLVLPCTLEELECEAHARALLEIPRVLAIEPRRVGVPGITSEVVAFGQAKRMRLPGKPRLVALYGPHQYPLARALCTRYADAEMWYVAPRLLEEAAEYERLGDFDGLARRLAKRVIHVDTAQDTESLRRRLGELQVINPRPFSPRWRRFFTKAKAQAGSA